MKILVVDDENLVRRALMRACQSRGHEVKEAQGGVEGVRIWLEYKPDLVFLDVLMPDLNGPHVIEHVGLSQKTKIVLMSAYTGGYDLQKAKELGADIFIPKPFEDIFQIVELAEDLVGGRREFD